MLSAGTLEVGNGDWGSRALGLATPVPSQGHPTHRAASRFWLDPLATAPAVEWG